MRLETESDHADRVKAGTRALDGMKRPGSPVVVPWSGPGQIELISKPAESQLLAVSAASPAQKESALWQ